MLIPHTHTTTTTTTPPQTMWSFGTWIGTNYGCAAYRAGKGSLMNGYLVDCTYLRHYRTQGLQTGRCGLVII